MPKRSSSNSKVVKTKTCGTRSYQRTGPGKKWTLSGYSNSNKPPRKRKTK